VKNVIQRVKQKEDPQKIIKSILAEPALLDELVDTILHDQSSLKYRCEKIVRIISETRPELTYPYFDRFVGLLDCPNSFLRWGSIIIIANLSPADSQNKFDAIFDRYYALIKGKDMVAATNVLGNSWKIALAKPRLASLIAEKMLTVQKANYEHKGKYSPECRNVAIGNAIDSFAKFYDKIENKKPIVNFVKRQQKNSRLQVVKKARKFLKQFEIN
jgi:hypothetical protein